MCFRFPVRNIEENHVLQFSDNEDLMDQNDQFREDDKKDLDIPFFELESIVAATDNFSQAYKLGQGGLALFTRWLLILIPNYISLESLVICA